MVDEVSMVDDVLFKFMVESLIDTDPGIKILLVGDFKQLPPVENKFCHTSPLWNKVRAVELTEIHRQTDRDFLEALDDVREGRTTENTRRLIKERSVEEFPDEATVLTPFRRVAEDYNNDRLLELGETVYTSQAGMLKGDKWIANKIPEVLSYCRKARIIMLTNHPEGLWANGTAGKIEDADSESVTVCLERGNKVKVFRERHELLDGEGRPKIIFRQFPFQLAYAITIHKSQGMTIDKVAVDMDGHFAPGMTYVAMSRCRSKEGLYLIK